MVERSTAAASISFPIVTHSIQSQPLPPRPVLTVSTQLQIVSLRDSALSFLERSRWAFRTFQHRLWRRERLFPRSGCRCLAVFRGTILEEIRVLDSVQHLIQP